jgi:hypothetical protein
VECEGKITCSKSYGQLLHLPLDRNSTFLSGEDLFLSKTHPRFIMFVAEEKGLGIPPHPRSASSPDLNRIENVWRTIMKQRINARTIFFCSALSTVLECTLE